MFYISRLKHEELAKPETNNVSLNLSSLSSEKVKDSDDDSFRNLVDSLDTQSLKRNPTSKSKTSLAKNRNKSITSNKFVTLEESEQKEVKIKSKFVHFQHLNSAKPSNKIVNKSHRIMKKSFDESISSVIKKTSSKRLEEKIFKVKISLCHDEISPLPTTKPLTKSSKSLKFEDKKKVNGFSSFCEFVKKSSLKRNKELKK